MKYIIEYSCVSHIGKLRGINQDNFICNYEYMSPNTEYYEFPINGTVFPQDFAVFGVFDGMGGEECGEIAAFIAAETAAKIKFKDEPITQIRTFCKLANRKICDYAQDNSISSMGTTAAMLCFCEKEIVLCNVGDSKIFLFSEKNLEQISKDHITPGPYGKKPALLQNLGIPETEMIIEPYISRGEYRNGDRYLICSDGLTDMVPIEQIEEIVDKNTLEEATQRLLNEALENGGRDNITVMVFEIKQCKRNLMNFLYKKQEETVYAL